MCLGLLHQTIVLVVKGFRKIFIRLLKHFHAIWSLIVSIDLVVTGVVLSGSTFWHIDLDDFADLEDERDLFFFDLFLSF